MAKLPEKIEDWQAPWEKKNEELDAETAKELLFDLYRSVETKDTELKAQKSLVRTAEQEKADLQTQLDAKVSGDNSEAADLSRKLAAAEKKLSDRDKADADRRSLALDVALDIDGISARQAKALAPLLSGNNEDELKEAAESVISNLGLKIGTSTSDDDGGDEGSFFNANELRKRGEMPRTKGDPKQGAAGGRELPSQITPDTLASLVPL